MLKNKTKNKKPRFTSQISETFVNVFTAKRLNLFLEDLTLHTDSS